MVNMMTAGEVHKSPPVSTKVRVLIADRHPVVRYGLQEWVSAGQNFEVVGVARNLPELERVLLKCTPEILVMDLALLGDDAVSKWHELQAQVVGVKLVSFGSESNAEIRKAVDCGAAAHLLKSEELAKLDGMLASVHLGNSYLSKDSIDYSTPNRSVTSASARKLSDREIEILRLVVSGKTSTEISPILNIRPRTVNAHRANISKKLDIHRLADLVNYANSSGILDQD